MHIIILNSPLFREISNLYDEDSLPPIGLGLIATSLQKKGLGVELIDAVALNIPLADLIKQVSETKPSFICTNVFTTNLELVREFVESIVFKTHFIIGGLSTQSLYNEILSWKSDNPISIVHGDGELITADIIQNMVREQPKLENGNRQYYEVSTNSVYFVKDISTNNLNRAFFVNEPVVHPFGFIEANIITSRGCIYNCSFCAAARSLNKQFDIREKSVSSVVEEILHLTQIYPGLQSIRVLDDLFLKNGQSIGKAIEIFNQFNLQWRSMAHVQSFRGVDDQMVKLLRESGCNELFIGIESGSPKILKEIHKTTNLEVIKESISKLLRNGINVKGYFIYGFPGETLEDFEMTFSLAKYLKAISKKFRSQFRTSVFQYRPYHGTEIYHSLGDQFGSTAFSKVKAIEPNKELSDLVGRLQFNFHSGNYSSESIETVREFVYKTTNLNSVRIFAADARHKRPTKTNPKVPKLRALS